MSATVPAMPTPPTQPAPDADTNTLLRAVWEELSFPRRLAAYEAAQRRADILAREATAVAARDAELAARPPTKWAGGMPGAPRLRTGPGP